MRKILLLLCILSITLTAKAQLFSKNWIEGCYYDTAGVKHQGLIAWDPPSANNLFKGKGDNIFYKNGKKGEKIKLKNSEIRSFLLKNDNTMLDSFVVTKNKDFQKKPFLMVLFNNDTKIYVSYVNNSSPNMAPNAAGLMMFSPGYSGNIIKYYYGTNPDSLTVLNKKNFVEIMSCLLAGKPNVVAKIKDKTFKISKLEELLYFYRTDQYPKSML
ncbi:hypothetical protein [Mucilaginibacter phyllosphaerae]|uniref:Uncharacterized protein n=1 Tax=Mucilaginibacter phyllosphaerae TaxID=1812349 RepID=A0A4Y8A8V1_9SPHI|nr:hypothetical protein [Mucilaginibacter phyllosphaerae]MBB3970784.1 hypothetical protein [Mucilaginibacter phyllosphaerae]TEW64274.1 hypothetical protein E2R65_18180 [Mucilaginibacter phyllosphaerae]GGH04554.1 hypothetical protein GCM10007352_07870 [Mucilaginibacter phyllosphaerae]